jgi:hypothetical protein
MLYSFKLIISLNNFHFCFTFFLAPAGGFKAGSGSDGSQGSMFNLFLHNFFSKMNSY